MIIIFYIVYVYYSLNIITPFSGFQCITFVNRGQTIRKNGNKTIRKTKKQTGRNGLFIN